MPEGIGYGPTKVAGVRRASAKSIPPKGLPTQGNGAPYREKKSPLPPSNSSPDKGAAVGGGAKPKRVPVTKNVTKKAPKKGQRMREKGKGYSKL